MKLASTLAETFSTACIRTLPDVPLSDGNYGNFTGGASAAWTFSFAAYIGFVSFDNPGELLAEMNIFGHSGADAMSHIPCSLVAGFQFALELRGADALLCGADHIDREEPLGERQMRVMKDGASGHAVLIAAVNTFVQMTHLAGFPVRVKLHHSLGIATDAAQAVRPADALEMGDAPLFGVELLENFKDGGLFLVALHDKNRMP